VIEAARREADAYLLSCANIAAFGIIAELERALGRPVVTSNQAVLWDALMRIGHDDVAACPGRLFATPAQPARRSAAS
jgi:maleate cis-trans isomerase